MRPIPTPSKHIHILIHTHTHTHTHTNVKGLAVFLSEWDVNMYTNIYVTALRNDKLSPDVAY